MTPKFIIAIDYRANYGIGYDYIELNSTNVYDALDEADNFKSDRVYMIHFLEKRGNSFKGYCKETVNDYASVLCNRGNGWHRTNAANSEYPLTIERHKYRDGTTYVFKA